VMQRRDTANTAGKPAIIDGATLYLCRQGRRWVVVVESPRFNGAVAFDHRGRDAQDARVALLACARQACPDATIMSADGALSSEDYEWRVDVRGVETQPGDLGLALLGAFGTTLGETDEANKATEAAAPRPGLGRRCHLGLSPTVTGRPRAF
jgi:hypothetical protein